MPQTKEIVIKVLTGKSNKDLKGLKGNIQEVDKGVNNINTSSTKTGKGFITVFSGMKTAVLNAIPALRAFTAALVSTGVGALVVALGSMISLMTKALNKSKEFSKSLSVLKAISSGTENEIKALSTQAKELGSSTAFTATEVVNLQTELAKLGFTIADIRNATPAILDLAASLEVDLASAAEFAGSVVRSFGLSTTETQRVVDVMAQSTSSSALNFSSLTESMKLAAPTANALGISIEKTTALLGVLADTGLKGSIAGTGLSKTFIQLNKEGISLEEAMDKVRNSSNQLNTAVELVGIVGAKSLLNLANAGDKIADLEQKLNNAAGAANNIAQIKLDNLTGDLTKLDSAWEGLLLNIEDGTGALNKLSRGAIQFLTLAIAKVRYESDKLSDAWHVMTIMLPQDFNNSRNLVGGYLDKFGAYIRLFSNKAMLSISEIPLIGSLLNKDVIEQNIKSAEESLLQSNIRIEHVKNQFDDRRDKIEDIKAKLRADRQIKLAEAVAKKIDENLGLNEDTVTEDVDKAAEKVINFKKKLQEKIDAYEADTELKKIELEREKHLAELLQLELDETEKLELKEKINALYDSKRKKAVEKITQSYIADADAASDKEKKRKEDLVNAAIEQDNRTLGSIVELAGKGSAIGKAAAVAQVTMGGIEGVQNAYKTAQASPITAVFPAYPIIQAGLAAAFAGVQLKSILSTPKPSLSGSTGGGGGGSRPNVPSSAPPSFNVVGTSETNQLAQSIGQEEKQPIKAFVVSNDVSTAQALDRNIVETASIG